MSASSSSSSSSSPLISLPPLRHLGLPVVLHHGQVLRQVLEARLELGVLGVAEVEELRDQQVRLVPQLGRLAGVGGQQGAEVAQVCLRVAHRLLHAFDLDVSAPHDTQQGRLDVLPIPSMTILFCLLCFQSDLQ